MFWTGRYRAPPTSAESPAAAGTQAHRLKATIPAPAAAPGSILDNICSLLSRHDTVRRNRTGRILWAAFLHGAATKCCDANHAWAVLRGRSAPRDRRLDQGPIALVDPRRHSLIELGDACRASRHLLGYSAASLQHGRFPACRSDAGCSGW